MRIFEKSSAAVLSRLKGGVAVLFLFALGGLLLKPLAGLSYQTGSFWSSDILPFLILGLYYGQATAKRGGRLAHIVGNALVLGYSAALFRVAFTLIDFALGVGGYYSDAALANVSAPSRAITYALYPLIPWAAGNLGYFLGRGQFVRYLSASRVGLALLGLLALARFLAQPVLELEPSQGASWISITWGLLAISLVYAVVVARRGGGFKDVLGTCLALACIHLLVIVLIFIDDGLGLQTWYTTPPASGTPLSTPAHMLGHLVGIPVFGTLLWGPASLAYLLAGGRRVRRASLSEAEA